MLMDTENYSTRQEAHDREYLAAWAGMSEEKKAALARRGITGPIIEDDLRDADKSREKPGEESDATDWLARSKTHFAEFDVAGEIDSTIDELQEKFQLSAKQAKDVSDYLHERLKVAVQATHSLMLFRIVGFLLSGTKNLLVSIHGLAHAARIAEINGFKSMRASAKVCKSSHEWVRRAAWGWVDLLGLPPLQGAKSAEAREAYKTDKLNNHWRGQLCNQANLQQPAQK